MDRKYNLPIVLVAAAIFTFLFYKRNLGLNLFLYELSVIIALVATRQVPLNNRNGVTITGLFTVSAFATLITHSTFSYIANFGLFFIFTGFAVYPQARSFFTSGSLAIYNTLLSQRRLFNELRTPKITGGSVINRIWRARIFIIPIFIVILFTGIYSLSNPIFSNLTDDFFNFLDRYILRWITEVNFALTFTFMLGLMLANTIWLRAKNEDVANRDATATETLARQRKKQRYTGRMMDLKNEYRAALFLLFALNAIILVLNITDIIWVWFGFKWEGQFLKNFVHEGTYLLIVSILISILLVLYYFRNNLNFYSKNNLLKYLSYAWLAQNAFLALSVGMRNFWYIHYFALAYKRIGVFVFLLLTLYGLYTVYIKVKSGKSAFYLYRANAYAWLVVLTLTSVINWDILIAQYNFGHADKAYLHLNFMAGLSDTALPYTDKPLEEVKKMKLAQPNEYSSFEFSDSGSGSFSRNNLYLTPEQYCERVQAHKQIFIQYWENTRWQEWNWAEYNAYRNLKN